MTDRLKNKVAIITGAGSGMGAAMAKLFAAEGAKVVAADFNKDRVNEVVTNIAKDGGGEVASIKTDVSDEEDIKAMFKFAKDKFGQIDIVVNNAGIMDNMAPIGDLTDEMWKKVFAVNTDSVMYATREAVKEFLPKKQGVILNIASVGGTNGARAGVAYTASKHAVVGITKNTAYMYQKEEFGSTRLHLVASRPTLLNRWVRTLISLALTDNRKGWQHRQNPELQRKSQTPHCSWFPTKPVMSMERYCQLTVRGPLIKIEYFDDHYCKPWGIPCGFFMWTIFQSIGLTSNMNEKRLVRLTHSLFFFTSSNNENCEVNADMISVVLFSRNSFLSFFDTLTKIVDK